MRGRTIRDQDYLIKPMQKLNYKADPEGVCEGYVTMSILAFLSKDYQNFMERVKFLIQKRKGIITLAESVEKKLILNEGKPNSENKFTEDEQKIKDVRAFFTGIELFYQPHLYEEVFGENIVQGEIEKIAKVVASRAIEDKGGLKKLDSWPGIYTLNRLTDYINALDQTAREHKQDMAFKLEGHNHTIGLLYDAEKGTWTLSDANQLLIPNILPELLPQVICSAFGCNQDKIVAFETVPLTVGQDQEKAKNFIAELKQKQEFQRSHTITPEMAALRTSDKFTLAHLAARGGHLDLVQQLIERHHVNLNQPNEMGMTPLCFAASSGHAAIIRLAGERGIDLNQPDHRGITPILYAIAAGKVDVIKEFARAGVDLAQPVVEASVSMTLLQFAQNAKQIAVVDFIKKQMEEKKKSEFVSEEKAAVPPLIVRLSQSQKQVLSGRPLLSPRPSAMGIAELKSLMEQRSAEKEIMLIQMRIQMLRKSLEIYQIPGKKIKPEAAALLKICDELGDQCNRSIEAYKQNKTTGLQSLKMTAKAVSERLNYVIEEQVGNMKSTKPSFFHAANDPLFMNILGAASPLSTQTVALKEKVEKSNDPLESIRLLRTVPIRKMG